MMNKKAQIVERRDVVRDYGFAGIDMIIDHPRHGRLMLSDAFGGIDDKCGGCVRWRHGTAMKLLPRDTFDNLTRDDLSGWDDSRPYLNWKGFMIVRLANSLL